MSEQTELVTRETQELETGVCAWSDPASPCPPATQRLTVSPAQHTTRNAHGIKVLKRAAIAPWCCDNHMRSLHRNNHDTHPASKVVLK